VKQLDLNTKLIELATELNYHVTNGTRDDGVGYVRCATSETSPIVIMFYLEPKVQKAFVVGRVRTTSWQFDGERTDLHDLISTLWTVILRAMKVASGRLAEEPHPAVDIPGEIYARYIFFEQPSNFEIQDNEHDLEWVKTLLISTLYYVAMNIQQTMFGEFTPEEVAEIEAGYSYKDAETFARVITEVTKDSIDSVIYNRRTNPSWLYFRSVSKGVSIVKFENDFFDTVYQKLKSATSVDYVVLDGTNRRFFTSKSKVSGDISNAISKKRLSFAAKLMRVVLGLSSKETVDYVVVPLETHFCLATSNTMTIIESESGYSSFLREREKIRIRHDLESQILFPVNSFIWKKQIDDDRFEQMIQMLVSVEPGVQWCKKVGEGREPDAGRDLICEWYLPPTPYQNIADETPLIAKRIVVQCKAYQRNVDKSKVLDIRDTVDNHNAQGYLLVAYPSITVGLLEYLEKLRMRGELWVEWWTQVEIEDRLRKHPNIAQKFDDLLEMKP